MNASLDKKMDRVIIPGLLEGRKVYVLKRMGTRQFVVGDDGVNVTLTENLAEARQFSSRLAARGYTMNNDRGKAFCAAEWEYIQIELVPEPEKIELVDGIRVSDPVEAMRIICELHGKYCDRIEEWIRHATRQLVAFNAPRVMITVRAQKWAGLYTSRDHTCHYVLPYAMLHLGDKTWQDFEEIVAHEVVHAYQQKFTGYKPGHGGDFYALMKHAALYPTTRHTHSFSIANCVKLAKNLQKPVEQMASAGLLTSLPCEVVTEKLKRQGIG